MSEPNPEPVTPSRRRSFWKWFGWGSLLVVVGLGWWIGPVIRDFFKAGFFDKTTMRTYSGDNVDNLRAMHMAMMVYHDSEEMFPDSRGWMDAIEPRIQVNDMKKEESFKKMVAPSYLGQPGKYGYGMNDACSKMYKDDLPDPRKTPLLFLSKDPSRNAHGDPKNDRAEPTDKLEVWGITVEGQLLAD